MTDKQQPKSFIFHGEDGGANGAFPLEYLRFISRETGLQPHELFDFFIGDSVSSLFATALNIPDPKNPEKAMYTVEDIAEIFYRQIADFIPYETPFTSQKRLALNKYKDRSALEQGLMSIFGQATFSEALNSIIVSSCRMGPGKPGEHFFTHLKGDIIHWIQNESLPESLVPAHNIPLYQASLASMAHPLLFEAYTLPTTGTTHRDLGALANHGLTVAAIKNSLDPEYQLGYVQFGTGDTNTELLPEQINSGPRSISSLGAIIQSAAAGRADNQSASIKMTLGGAHNIHVLQMSFDSSAPHRKPIDNKDTRPEAMLQRQEMARWHIEEGEPDTFKRVVQDLQDNHALKTQPSPTAAFVNAAEQTEHIPEKSWAARLVGRLTKIIPHKTPDTSLESPAAVR